MCPRLPNGSLIFIQIHEIVPLECDGNHGQVLHNYVYKKTNRFDIILLHVIVTLTKR